MKISLNRTWLLYPGRAILLIALAAFVQVKSLAAQNGSAYAAEASVTPAQIKTGQDVLLTYTFKVVSGSPTLWRIKIPWAGNVYVKAVEKNSQSLWLINRSEAAPRTAVVSWFHDKQFLELKSFSGDVKTSDIITVVFAIHAPDSLSTQAFDGWIGDAGSPAFLSACVSKSTEIKTVPAR